HFVLDQVLIELGRGCVMDKIKPDAEFALECDAPLLRAAGETYLDDAWVIDGSHRVDEAEQLAIDFWNVPRGVGHPFLKGSECSGYVAPAANGSHPVLDHITTDTEQLAAGAIRTVERDRRVSVYSRKRGENVF